MKINENILIGKLFQIFKKNVGQKLFICFRNIPNYLKGIGTLKFKATVLAKYWYFYQSYFRLKTDVKERKNVRQIFKYY